MGEQVRIRPVGSGRHGVHIRRLYIELLAPASNQLRLWLLRLLILRDGVLLLLLMVVLITPPVVPPVVGRRCRVVGVVPKLVVLMTSSSSSATALVRVVVMGRSTCQHLVEVVVLKRLSLEDKVRETAADLTEDASSSGSVANATSCLRR